MAGPKIGLAAQLAKQASEAALAEFKQGEGGGASAKAAGWQVPELGDFVLDAALARAVARVADTYGATLAPEGLRVELAHTEEAGQMRAEVREGATGRVLRAYSAPELVGLFAAQRGEKGVVADGVV